MKVSDLFYKTGGKCVYCGSDLEGYEDITVDHFIPKCRGVILNDEKDDLLPCCLECNKEKGDELYQLSRAEYLTNTEARRLLKRYIRLKGYSDLIDID